MSRARFFEPIENQSFIDENSIFCKENKYGYKLNINHPKIRELYNRYKAWKGISQQFPLSDQQRFEFEDYILKSKSQTIIAEE